jgi:pimeloyl-ACP methyl ester carboxylesterase
MPFAISGGAQIHYVVEGRGDAILLVPGLGGSTRQLAKISAALAQDHLVVTVDPRGAGQSDKPDMSYDGALLAGDMLAVLDHAGVERADFVGISFGGMIGQEMAIHHPARLRSLFLASSYARSDAWTDRMWQVREMLISRLGLAEHFKLAIMFLFSPRSFRTEAGTVAAIEAAVAANPPDPVGYRRQLEFCRDYDASRRLGKIGLPTLVVQGAEDILASPIQGRELAQAIPGARFREVPEAAHLFMLSQPLAFARMIGEFVAECRRRTGA